MALDQTANFIKIQVSGTHSDTDTTISLAAGEASNCPDPSSGEYNMVWWDINTANDPADDANVEIVRVTGRDTGTDELTVTRAQEGISASTKNNGGGNYKLILGITSKMVDDIETDLGNKLVSPIAGTDVELSEVGTATYDDVQDWLNNTQSAGLVSGGDFTDNGDGTVTVAAGTGFIKTTDDILGTTKSFDWSSTDVTPTDGSLNYVYVDYNAGSPTVNVTTTKTTVTHTDTFLIGKVYQEGTTAHYLEGGTEVYNLARRTQERLGAAEGFERVSGMATSESGTRNVAITAGKFFRGLNPYTTSSFDSSGADTFSLWDNSGTWNETTGQSTIPETYDDGDGTPASLGNNDFGVFWVYMHEDGDVHIIYGTQSYNSAALAEAATPRTGLPTKISSMGVLIAQVVISEAAADGFEAVHTPWENGFVPTAVTDHGDLAGLTDDDHTQYILHSLAGAANDFLVASGANTYVKKTLAETGAILEGDIDHGNLQGLSTGADHSYIDQDVTSGSTPTFTGTNFSSIPASALPDADDDGTTKGVATFDNTDFNATAGVITINDGGISHDSIADVSTSDHHTKYALTDDLASGEITQLQAIGAVTITNTQWGYLGAMGAQPLETVDAIGEIDASLKTGSDSTLVTGTSGSSGNIVEWDANGDAVDSGHSAQDSATKTVSLKPIAEDAALETGDNQMKWVVPADVGGMDLVDADAHVFTVSSSGTPTIQVHNATDTVDMLTTRITIDASEKDSSTAATAPAIDTANDDVVEGDEIRIDVDTAGTGTAGLEVRLSFR